MSHPLRRAWVPALLWLAVIAWESTPYASSANTAGILGTILRFLGPPITAAQLALLNAIARKCGHFVGYGLLSLLLLRAWWATVRVRRRAEALLSWKNMLHSWSARAAALALASTVLVAALDEWHQASIPGRGSSWRDVALDGMAAAFVQVLVIALDHAEGGPISN